MTRPGGGGRSSLLGPALLLLALASAALWVRRPPVPEAPPAGLEPPSRVSGWAGRAPEGGLELRLTPLHAEPGRQAFEARVLRERWGLPPGEPWRLELRVVDGAPEPGELTILDGGGAALRPLGTLIPPAADGAPDPLAVLFGLPDRLERGEWQSIVLWGRPPAGEAWIAGGEGSLAPAASSVPLVAEQYAPALLPRHLARVDRKAEEGAGSPAGRTVDR